METVDNKPVFVRDSNLRPVRRFLKPVSPWEVCLAVIAVLVVGLTTYAMNIYALHHWGPTALGVNITPTRHAVIAALAPYIVLLSVGILLLPFVHGLRRRPLWEPLAKGLVLTFVAMNATYLAWGSSPSYCTDTGTDCDTGYGIGVMYYAAIVVLPMIGPSFVMSFAGRSARWTTSRLFRLRHR
jgi:hypothetical protein